MQDYLSTMSFSTQEDQIARRIQALREARNLTQAALAGILGFNDRQTLAAIEAGARRVRPEELVRVAEALGVDVELFLDPYLLIGEGSFSFRAREVEESTLAAFEEQARRWIATYRELGRQTGSQPRRLGRKLELYPWSSFEDAEASAEMLWREWELGDVPAERLEDAIETQLGALMLYVDAAEGISGAASQLPGLHTILVNRRESPGRRSFDLAHELFHVLTWDAMPPRRVEPVEVKPTKGNRVEQMAESFAAALLMPSPIVSDRWNARGGEELPLWVGRIAAQLRVSIPALQWRLVNLGLMSKAQAQAQAVGSAPRVAAAGAGLPPLFSRRFIERVAGAVEAGRLSMRRAASLLGLSLAELADVCAAHGHPLSYQLPG
jgi:Zn-dependent peptidase ImmA (M78 family)/DNA-binding XRE family transcriptional regulator